MARAVLVGTMLVAMAGAFWLANAAFSQERKEPIAAHRQALAAFDRIASVLDSPRCLNCHPRGDRPSQGDDRRAHSMNVQRGPADRGLPGMACATCHAKHNNDRAGVPGAPHWRLAPRSMGWSGLGRRELCATLRDRSKNGGRSPAALLTHMTADPLVLWAWHPGTGRASPPLSHGDLQRALTIWIKGGAPCPS
jgi:hypothetical protein